MADNKKIISKFKIIYFLISILTPTVIILTSGIIPKGNVTWVFFVITIALYITGVVLTSKTIDVKDELNEILRNQKENSQQLLSNEDRFQNLDSLIQKGKDNKFKNIYNSYYAYKQSLRGISEEDTSGQVIRKLYSTSTSSYFFDEDSLIYKNIYYKTINYITQALTGIGIFGTFLGIVDGISGLEMGNAQAMKNGISNLLDGVSVSFNTSLYGILFSVILTFILKISIEVTMKKSNELCDELDKIVPKSSDKEGLKELEIELKKQTLSIEKLATDLAEEMGKKFDISMQENLSRLTEDLGVFVAKMETNIANSLSETNASTALALNSSLQPTMQKLEAVMTNIQTQQEQSSMKFIEESMQAMKEAINIGTNDEMDKLKSTMEIISAKNSEMVETFTSSMENMKMLTLHQENLIKNTTTSTESMNVTTENIKELQDNLGVVIQSLKDVSSNNNISLTNIQDTIESMKDSMSKQLTINKSVEDMVDKAVNLTQAQDQYISKLDKISRVLDYNMENTQKYISDVTNGISEYKNYFERIKASTIDVANTLDSKYKNIVNDLSIVNKNLSTTVESVDKNLINKVNIMTNQVQSLVKDLNEYQAKTASLTNKIERFAQVEESTQELWMNYKESFEKLNETINDGVENYNKHINNGVTDVLNQFDTNISSAVDSLRKVADTLADSAEEISDNLEALNTTSATR